MIDSFFTYLCSIKSMPVPLKKEKKKNLPIGGAGTGSAPEGSVPVNIRYIKLSASQLCLPTPRFIS